MVSTAPLNPFKKLDHSNKEPINNSIFLKYAFCLHYCFQRALLHHSKTDFSKLKDTSNIIGTRDSVDEILNRKYSNELISTFTANYAVKGILNFNRGDKFKYKILNSTFMWNALLLKVCEILDPSFELILIKCSWERITCRALLFIVLN